MQQLRDDSSQNALQHANIKTNNQWWVKPLMACLSHKRKKEIKKLRKKESAY